MLKRIQCNRRALHTTLRLGKGNVSWNVALDPSIPADRSVKAFKVSLQETISNNAWPSDSSRERRVLLELINKALIPHDTLKKQIKKLQLLILQKRVSDNDIRLAIAKINADQIINVVTPKPINLKKELQNLEKTASLVEERPRSKMPKSSQRLLVSHDINPKPEHIEKSNSKKNTEAETITDQDIEALKKFLEKAETQEKQIKKFVLEQQRKYKWSSNQGPSTRMTSGSMIFQEQTPSSRLRKGTPINSYLLKYDSFAHPFSPIKIKEVLVYDVNKSKGRIEPPESTILVHVQKKDLFSVVNGGRIAPDQLLEIINKYENKGWKLIGDINNDTYNVVFQKSYVKPALIERKSKLAIGLSGLILGYLVFGGPLLDHITSLDV
ncbi:unnamed protein product [Kluyveromyces dobzhanskii CBS 2104]|uniref:WGS project CCBQ000000000 data, contig 00099 n=1 Tax=Kluyveromyces dobzhanskii CBS 2104 TaxID=1427455 RepID=A0A0A8L289_9SACH|nr:unnamed protein product [Kluyveromyces dobzhanskii CBS 2104]